LASGKAANPRRRKVARRKRPVVAKRRVRSDRAGDLGVAALQEQLEQKARELNEALEQQAATAEVLGVINASRGDLQPVFEAMVEKARRLCQADAGHLALPVGDDYRSVAVAAMSREMEVLIGSVSYAPGRGTAIGRALAERRPVQISDIGTDTEHIARQAAHKGFIRTILGVPLLREGEAIGAFGLSRQRIEPFSERQIELVRTFADQAVIAIENTRLLNELRQSLEQQTATADVLRVISSSPGDLEPVFQTLLANAVRICEANFGTLFVVDGDEYRTAAGHNMPSAFLEQRQRTPMVSMTGDTALARVARTKRPVQISDVAEDPAYRSDAQRLSFVSQTGARTVICVPMLKDGALVGAIAVYRQEVRPFADNQIELLTNFAAQAVIAIENTRLLSELRESLDQQTATADVLRVISSSPGALEPVFRSILDNATRICQANFATLFLREGEALRVAAHHGSLTKAWDEQWRVGMLLQPDRELQAFQTLSGRQPLQVVDLSKAPSYLARNPKAVNSVETGGIRTMITVPMLKDGEAIGVITIFRTEVREFTEKQIALVTNFAAQAVIAIENTRLLNELRESLEQQTATADVLRVISSSPGDLEPVFRVMLENATRICEAKFGTLALCEGDALRAVALHGGREDYADERRRNPVFRPAPNVPVMRAVRMKQVQHVANMLTEQAYIDRDAAIVTMVETGGARTFLAVPMLKDDEAVGVIIVYRQEVRPFSDKQIALVQNFAAQAVIAIENTRLLNELRQRTDDLSDSLARQTATSEVLGVISRSKFELQPILQSVVDTAARLCRAERAVIFRLEGGTYRFAAGHSLDPAYLEIERQSPISPGQGSVVGRAAMTRQVARIDDAWTDPLYDAKDDARIGGVRSMIGVPLMREGESIGVIALARIGVEPFGEREIELVTTFADQAVIAIENVRLFDDVQKRTQELSKSLEDLRTAQDRLVQTEKLASLGQLTAGIAHEIKNPLNFVNNFSSLSVELIGELQDELGKVKVDSAARDAITDVAETLKGNLEKIAHHGKRADAIVKNMLLHSREGSGDHRPVDVNALVEESLNLAYHGARAEKQGFNIALERSFDAAAGEVDLYPQEVTRVLLNIIANGFYAAHKRKSQVGGADFEPMLVASTKSLGDRVEIRVRDNGTGIPPEVKEKMFNPFFTTKPAGEGTGLGLSISHDIIVKQHAGTIAVETQPGQFTEFTIVLPRNAATAKPVKPA
jgi:GAF domain-containing protein